MGMIAQCDGGCGATTNDLRTFKEFGIVKKVWYCEDCGQNLQDLYDIRDALHTYFVSELHSRLLQQVSEFKKSTKHGKLPDAPE
jgi:hypothetical protein